MKTVRSPLRSLAATAATAFVLPLAAGLALFSDVRPVLAVAPMPPGGFNWAIQNHTTNPEVFLVGLDGHPYHDWCCWSGWQPLGGNAYSTNLIDGITVATNADGRMEAFATESSTGQLWHSYQTSVGGGWANWVAIASYGGFVGIPKVGRNADGRLEVFERGSDRNMYHVWQVAPNGSWSTFSPLSSGTWHHDPAVAGNADGRLEVFAIGDDGHMYHLAQASAGGRWWQSWADLGGNWGPINNSVESVDPMPGVARNALGELVLEAYQSDLGISGGWSDVWQNRQSCAGCGWVGWQQPQGAGPEMLCSNPAFGVWPSGLLDSFDFNCNGGAWAGLSPYYSSEYSTNAWSGWLQMPPADIAEMVNTPGVTVNQLGTLSVYAIKSDTRELLTAWWTGGGWAGWVSLGGTWPLFGPSQGTVPSASPSPSP